jgi:NAD(P)-dependent dehydrogenase (short-subunit alcohol dehydrogenase family)
VTGANGGLGFETAVALVARGARVVLAVRDAARGEDARTAILREAPRADAEVIRLDLGSLASVHEAAATIAAAHPAIDLLVANAGVMGIPRRTTSDGFEAQFGINHLGHFALTALLMPALLRAPAARVVSVTSGGRWLGRTVDPGEPVRGRPLVRALRPSDLRTLWEVSERETGIRFDVPALVAASRAA